jgi:hypothetical protein
VLLTPEKGVTLEECRTAVRRRGAGRTGGSGQDMGPDPLP